MMLQLTLGLCLAVTGTLEKDPAPLAGRLLPLVPESAFAMLHCEDFDALRQRMLSNDWVRLMAAESGAPLLDEVDREFQSQTHTNLLELLEVGEQLRGETLFFTTEAVAGLVTVAPASPDALANSMRAWLPESTGPKAISRVLEIAGARVELVAWPDSTDSGWSGRRGHYAAFVEHPEVLGLFSGDDLESLTAVLSNSLGALGGERQAPLVSGWLKAREAAPGPRSIQAFVDFTPFVKDAERELSRAVAGFFPNPEGMLGLEGGCGLWLGAEIYAGERVDVDGRLSIPKDTLIASLADSFQALPADLPQRLPADLRSLHAWNWDLKAFYRTARAAAAERHGEDSLAGMDQALEAAKGMTGIDPIKQVVEQLAGTMALFEVGGEATGEGSVPSAFERMGFLAKLVDGDVFTEAFESLIGGGPLESQFDLIDIEDTDAYIFGSQEDDGGLAILPRTLIVGLTRDTLVRSLKALNGEQELPVGSGGRLHLAYQRSPGSCFFSCLRLADVASSSLGQARSPEGSEGTPANELPGDLSRALLVNRVRRTQAGFEFELRVQQ